MRLVYAFARVARSWLQSSQFFMIEGLVQAVLSSYVSGDLIVLAILKSEKYMKLLDFHCQAQKGA